MESVLPRAEYPRPNLKRSDWLNLNGCWRLSLDHDDVGLAEGWHQQELPGEDTVIVPYPIESVASGVDLDEAPDVVWYQRSFSTPESWEGKEICLRFGAVDYHAQVYVNGQLLGEHLGGYSPFGFRIPRYLLSDTNQLTVRVRDSKSWTQPRGKQAGTTRWPIDYDAVTGIWQTVWLEPVPTISIESIFPRYDIQTSRLTCLVGFSGNVEGSVKVELLNDKTVVAAADAEIGLRQEARVSLDITGPMLWSPAAPHLYTLRVTLNAKDVDQIESYCGLREIAVKDGVLQLNGEPLYIRGVLDQGYFPEGWYTALDDDAIRRDVELTLAMGFNCARKHQKAEDPRYLYWADKLGLLVWAEMPSGRIFSTELVETLTREWGELIVRDRSHPSLVTWVPFNESWGVWHQSSRPEQRAFVDGVAALTKALDPTRPVVGNDGWEFSSGDLWTLHIYEEGGDLSKRIGELMVEPQSSVHANDDEEGRRGGALPGSIVEDLPILLTECGGLGFGAFGEDDFSYGEIPGDQQELYERIKACIAVVLEVGALQGYVWTQLTDVQQEINGLLYFDRRPKLPLETYQSLFGSDPNKS